MGITVAVTQVAASTSTGNQDITTSALGGATPKAALLYVTLATTNGTAANGAALSIGAATATDERWAAGYRSEHGQGSTNTDRWAMTDKCIFIYDSATDSIDGEADFVSFIADGIRINWTNAPGAAYLVTAVLFAGDDLQAHAGTLTASDTSGTSTDITAPGFEPDAVLFATTGFAFDDANHESNWFSHGVAVNDGSATQRSWNYRSLNDVSSSETYAILSESYALGQMASSPSAGSEWMWAGEIGSFDANGFSCTTREGNSGGADDVGYLALNFNSAVSFAAGTVDAPTSTGDDSQTGAGFTPQFVLQGLTQLTAADSLASDGSAGSLGVSVFDTDDEYSVSTQDEDAAGTTDTQSLADNQAINFPQDDGTTGYTATFSSFDANGWTLNFTNVLGTATKWWYLAIGTITTQSDTTTAYTVLSETQTETITAWTILSQSESDTVTGWVNLTRTQVETVTGWATLKAGQSDTTTAWTYLSEVQSNTVTGWANLTKAQSDTVAGWTTLKAGQSDTTAAWVALSTGFTETVNVWANLLKTQTDIVSAWANLFSAVTQSDTVTAWAILSQTNTDTVIGWANLRQTQTETVTGWTTLMVAQSETVTTYTVLTKTQSDTTTAYAVLAQTQSETVTAWAFLAAAQIKITTAWTTLTKAQVEAVSVYTTLTEKKTEIVTAWAILSQTQTEAVTGWANILKGQNDTVAAWAVLQAGKSETVTAWTSIITVVTRSDTTTAWTILRAAQTETVTGWATLQDTQTDTVTVFTNIRVDVAGLILLEGSKALIIELEGE